MVGYRSFARFYDPVHGDGAAPRVRLRREHRAAARGARRGAVDWGLRIFEHLGGGNYRLHEETIAERAFRTALASLDGEFAEVLTAAEAIARLRPRPGGGGTPSA